MVVFLMFWGYSIETTILSSFICRTLSCMLITYRDQISSLYGPYGEQPFKFFFKLSYRKLEMFQINTKTYRGCLRGHRLMILYLLSEISLMSRSGDSLSNQVLGGTQEVHDLRILKKSFHFSMWLRTHGCCIRI